MFPHTGPLRSARMLIVFDLQMLVTLGTFFLGGVACGLFLSVLRDRRQHDERS